MYDANFKIVIFGDSDTGKVELTQRLLTNLYTTDSKMTIGVDFEIKSLIVDDLRVKLQIWDFGGEERFRFLLPTYIRGARGGMFVYDITNYSTIAHIDDWLTVIKKEIREEDTFPIVVPIVVVGNRAHLVDQREVSSAEGIIIAKSRGVDAFIECSAKTGENVKEAFEVLTRLMLDHPTPRELGVRAAAIDKIGFKRMKESIQRYIRQQSKKNKQITRAKTIKAIKKSLKLAGENQSWDEEIWALTKSEIKIKKILELEKEKKREESLSRKYKILQEGTQLEDKTLFMNQNLEQWLETLKSLNKGCEEITKTLRDKNEHYYYHISLEQWKYLLRVTSELLGEFKETPSSFYEMSDDTKRKLYNLFEIFIPCREILSDGSFGKYVRVSFDEYLKILKLEKKEMTPFTQFCKHCGAPLDEGVSVCPNCKKKTKG